MCLGHRTGSDAAALDRRHHLTYFQMHHETQRVNLMCCDLLHERARALRHDTRLPRVLHALLHLEGLDHPVTSRALAEMLGTNGAVVRRIMGGLRDVGVVASAKGHGGGWSLARPLSEISLLMVYEALGSPPLFAIGHDGGSPSCLLARAANEATAEALKVGRAAFEKRLSETFVSDLAVARAAKLGGGG